MLTSALKAAKPANHQSLITFESATHARHTKPHEQAFVMLRVTLVDRALALPSAPVKWQPIVPKEIHEVFWQLDQVEPEP